MAFARRHRVDLEALALDGREEFPFVGSLEALGERLLSSDRPRMRVRELDGDIDAPQQAGLEEHLAQCPDCVAHRDAIRLEIARLQLGAELYAEAGSVLEELELPPNPRALLIECRLAIDTSSWEQARVLAGQLAEADEPGMARMLEGEIAVGEQRWSRAEDKFEEAIALLGPYRGAAVAEVYREAGRPEKGLELLLSMDPGVPNTLVGDPLRLGQVLTNLAGNAVKFTHAGEVVIVRADLLGIVTGRNRNER